MAKLAEYTTEKRPAKVGEQILITAPYITGDYYDRHSVLTVCKVVPEDDDNLAHVYVNEVNISINDSEYEVIIENGGDNMNAGIIEKMQAEIAELQAKVAKLEGGKMATMHAGEVVIPAKSVQQQRDEIVAKAKADIEELSDGPAHKGLVYLANHFGCYAEFIVNKEKRTVAVLLRGYSTDKIRAKGIAKCAPNDCFNSHIGRAIALRRALGLEVPAEYLKVLQPTEVRVGDIASTEDILGNTYKITVNCEAVQAKFIEDIARERYGTKIIDDSREEMGE